MVARARPRVLLVEGDEDKRVIPYLRLSNTKQQRIPDARP